MNKKLLLIGGGGHCKSVIDSLFLTREYYSIGVVENSLDRGDSVMGVPIVGNDDDLPTLYHQGYRYAFFAVGSTANPSLRIGLFAEFKRIGFLIPNIIDPSAVVSTHTVFGEGIYVGKNAVVNAGSKIGNGVIINTGAIIEHDCRIGEFGYIAPGSVLGGGVSIGDYTHIGEGCIIRQRVSVGSDAMISIGSIVTKDVADGMTVSPNPYR